MMPTTREASTPSRSAIRRAESTKTPVVSYLQLQFKCTALRTSVNRTSLVLYPLPGWVILFDAHAHHPHKHLPALVDAALRAGSRADTLTIATPSHNGAPRPQTCAEGR